MGSNFFLQDLIGITLALFLFSLVFVFPGYVIGWALNLLRHRTQPLFAQLTIGVFISISIVPAFLFLVYRLLSPQIGIGVLVIFAIAAIYIYSSRTRYDGQNEVETTQAGYQNSFLFLILLWILFSVFVSVDLQIGNKLYFSNNSYDMLTRVAVVDAITRTGVPPVNPSYYPGEEVLLNFLYYFWYILVSVVDMVGGSLVSAFHAMIASISWCGIALFASISAYVQFRAPLGFSWKKNLIGIQLFVISGLDCIIILYAFLSEGYLPANGQLEGWNMPIMSWLNAVIWVPHHVSAAIACIFALLLLFHERTERLVDKLTVSSLIGLAFASAFGLSVWVMFVFAIFWVIWAVFTLAQRNYACFSVMVFSAVFAILFVAPFLFALLTPSVGSQTDAQSVLPVAFYIRPFMLSAMFLGNTYSVLLGIVNFIFLPLNYLFELGFFFIVAAIWIQEIYARDRNIHLIYKAELVLVFTTTLVLSFLYSNIISINDLGIRGWLPMQFILIVWAVDVIIPLLDKRKWISPGLFQGVLKPKNLSLVLSITMVLGVVTTSLEAVSLRMYPMLIDLGIVKSPNAISRDDQLGVRTFHARQAYQFIDENTPANIIIQYNPLNQFDRPSGLYGRRQMAISDRTIYGVSLELYSDISKDVGTIFNKRAENWEAIDAKCDSYQIDLIIVNDTDLLWDSLQTLKIIRKPVYENEYYAVYTCGK